MSNYITHTIIYERPDYPSHYNWSCNSVTLTSTSTDEMQYEYCSESYNVCTYVLVSYAWYQDAIWHSQLVVKGIINRPTSTTDFSLHLAS